MTILEPFFAPSPDESTLTAILESVTDAVYLLDNAWRFDYLNPRAEALLQRPRAEFVVARP